MGTPTPIPSLIEALPNIVTLAQCIISTLALIIGGFWTISLFRLRREKYPKAKVSHVIFSTKIGRKKRLLHINVKIENLGQVLIKINKGEIRILQIIPFEWSLVKPDQKTNEIEWYQIGGNSNDIKLELEPGESDELCYDFIIENNIKVIEVYTHYTNVEKGTRIGWPKSTIHIFK